jgi:hypothetical protein
MDSRIRNSHRATIFTLLAYHLLWRHVGLFLALLILPLFATAHAAKAA